MISTHWYYMLVNLGCLIVPFFAGFHPRLQFHKQWKRFFPAVAAMMCLFIPWDIYFTVNSIWGFNTEYTTGIFLLRLPIEEWLFFVCIPYACIFTYHCFQILMKQVPFEKALHLLAWALAITSLIVAFCFTGRWYTYTAHLLCGIILLVHLLRRTTWLTRFVFMYLVILPAFIASNGILTGITFWKYPFLNHHPENIAEKIVWYDNAHNLQVRLFSIPLDDIAYGLVMLLIPVTIYEVFKTRLRRV